MKIAVISDLHIGHNFETHQLGHSDHDFAKFLFKLEKIYDKIVLLGDIYEIEMENYLSDVQTIESAKKQHKAITKRFKKKKYIYVYGNHDLIGEQYGAQEHYTLKYSDKKYLFIHGHQFDYLYQASKSKFSFLGGLCLKLNQKSIYKWVTENSSFGSFSIRKENEKFQKRALEYAADNYYDYIITGHTHEPKIIPGNPTYLNSGTCTYGRISYIHMDLDKEKFEIKYKI